MKYLLILALLPISSAVPGCSSALARPEASDLVLDLGDQSRRNDAVCALLRRGDYAHANPRYRERVPEHGCDVRSIFNDTAHPGGTILALLKSRHEPQWPGRSDFGHLIIFDAGGRLVPVFEGASHLGETDGVAWFRADGSLAVVHQFGYGVDPDWTVQALHVVPARIEQAPILSVLIGDPLSRGDRSRKWKWESRDVDGDGTAEFMIGPVVDGVMEHRATYRYSPATKRYEGPRGALDGEFYLLRAGEAKDNWTVARDFARAHGIHTRPLPKRRRCPCRDSR